MKVLKFGGTSVGSAQRIKNVEKPMRSFLLWNKLMSII